MINIGIKYTIASYHVFFIAFTLYLGTFKDKAGIVAGIPMMFNFIQQLLLSIPLANYILPFSLILNQTGGDSIVVSIILGEPFFSILPIVSTLLLDVLFIILATWKFKKQEL